MAILETFNPSYGSGIHVLPNGTSASVNIGAGEKTICITSLNAVQCYVRVGGTDVVATTSDYPIPVGGQVTITKKQDANCVAYIAPTGTGDLHIMVGEGF
jgi:hypothetical protein